MKLNIEQNILDKMKFNTSKNDEELVILVLVRYVFWEAVTRNLDAYTMNYNCRNIRFQIQQFNSTTLKIIRKLIKSLSSENVTKQIKK